MTEVQTDLSLDTISDLLTKFCSERFGIDIEQDFLYHAVTAIQNLKEAGRLNVIYHLSKGLSIQRSDGSDTLFPIKRMPMGLLEYISGFFTSSNSRSVSAIVLQVAYIIIAVCNYTCRCLTVHLTTDFGSILCMPTLVRSGPSSIMDHCGVLCLQCSQDKVLLEVQARKDCCHR